MHKTKQFQTSSQKRTFYDRKILKYGESRCLALGKLIPKDWIYVRIRLEEEGTTKIVVSIQKLLGNEPIAQNKKTN